MSVCVGESSVSCRVFSTKNSESKNHGNLMGVNHAGHWPLIKVPLEMYYHLVTKRTLLGNEPSLSDTKRHGFNNLT